MQKNIISLPQITLSFRHDLPSHQYLFVSGGRPPQIPWLQTTAGQRTLWCIDHGIDCCYAAKLIPEHLFGDGDSASKEAWHWAESQGTLIEKYATEKDFTDTQLALEYVSRDQEALVILTGCFGKRFDHFYSTLFSCAHAEIPVCLADEQEFLFPLKGGQKLTLRLHSAPLALSLLPLTDICKDVAIDHVHWPLQNATLRQSCPQAVSNVPKPGQPVTISLSDGILGIYLYWENTL